tara:strand:- start:422 stop:715 length:294 start_codon:yes stop_codon:yes gene_type:complete
LEPKLGEICESNRLRLGDRMIVEKHFHFILFLTLQGWDLAFRVFYSVFVFEDGLSSRYPQPVDHSRNPEEESEDDVDQKVFACASCEKHTQRGKQYT